MARRKKPLAEPAQPSYSERVLTDQQLGELTCALEGHLLETLTSAVYRVTPHEGERLLLAGGVATLLMRHYARAHPDPLAWTEKAVTAILA